MKKNWIPIFLALSLITIRLPSIAQRESETRSIHVFVALCDRQYQGIISSNPVLEDGDRPETNQYWGALYGLKTVFKKDKSWSLLTSEGPVQEGVLERCVFYHPDKRVYMVADAYRGREIKKAIGDFLGSLSGSFTSRLEVRNGQEAVQVGLGANADLVVYVGHNGLMDFRLDCDPRRESLESPPDAMMLACKSKPYFEPMMKQLKVMPILWTTGLMAPEAYTLEAAFKGWMNEESSSEVADRAAIAYHRYQKCGLTAAKRLLVSGW